MTFKKANSTTSLVAINIGLTEGLSSAFFTVVATRLGAVPLLIGAISTGPYIGNIFSPLWAHITENIKINKALSTAILLDSLILAILAFVGAPIYFTLLALVYFILFGALDVLQPALIDLLYSESAVRILARLNELNSLSYTFVVAFSGLLMELWSHKITFLAGASLLLISGLLILRNEPKTNKNEIKKTHIIEILKEDPDVLNLVYVFMVAGTGMLMMLPAIPILEVNILNFTNTQIGIVLAVNSIAYILGTEFWTHYVKSMFHLRITFIAGLIAIIGMALIYLLFPNFWTFIIANIFCGIGGSSISFFWETFSISNPDYRTEDLSSLHLLTCGIRGLYAPFLGAIIITKLSIKADFLLSIIFIVSGLLIFIIKSKYIFNTLF
jgi:MFS family permease